MKNFTLWCATLGLACAADITPQSYLDHIKYLASPELKGRATGSPELEKAASYIAAQFKAAGLKPGGAKKREMKPSSRSMPSDWKPEKSCAAATKDKKQTKHIASDPRGQMLKITATDAIKPTNVIDIKA